jgi:hypothetical protein
MADSNDEVSQPRKVDETRWQVASPLKPGTVYQWSVTAQRGTDLLRSPAVKFYVLGAREQEELAQARRKLAGNPLALAAVYARLGLQREAEVQLAAALESEPQNAIAKRWLTQIRSRRSIPPEN